jgi:hypothetical protein
VETEKHLHCSCFIVNGKTTTLQLFHCKQKNNYTAAVSLETGQQLHYGSFLGKETKNYTVAVSLEKKHQLKYIFFIGNRPTTTLQLL